MTSDHAAQYATVPDPDQIVLSEQVVKGFMRPLSCVAVG
jgi:hypothetical protein